MAELTGRDKAFKLFDEGKRPSDTEVKALGLKARSTYTYFQQWKKGDGSTSEPSDTTTLKTSRTITGRLEVGKITIATENWTINQFGALLILDTFIRAKLDLGYEGAIGEFICDVMAFYRRIQNYKEVEHGREGSESDGEESAEAVPRLAG